jgi:hypothetical protein
MCHLRTFTTMLALALLAQAPSVAAEGGLSPSQVRQLESVGFAVVPQAPPSGFHARSVSVDPSRRTYTVVYAGPDGQTITISGSALHGKAAPASAPAAQPHGFFQKLFGGMKSMHVADPNATSNTAGEENEEMTAVSADSPLLGPVNFQKGNQCLNATNDPAKAQIRNAQFHVYGCNMREPDALIRAYRSLERVNR